jgi:CheY-like chemotaxis protein
MDARAPEPAPGPHVLVIDDDPIVRAVAVRLLEVIGCTASSLAEEAGVLDEMARAEAAGSRVALVLLDLNLAQTSGLAVCRRLRQGGVQVPIVCMSGDVAYTDAFAGKSDDFDGVLSKPFSLDALRECIGRHVLARPTGRGEPVR